MKTDNRDLHGGETMFEYLKRKKKNMLEQTLNRSKIENQQKKLAHNAFPENNLDFENTLREQSKQNSHRSIFKNSKNAQESSPTPKNITILEEGKQRFATRSFVQMISPIRSKSPIQKELQNSFRLSPNKPMKDNYKDNFTKKMVIQKINNLRQVLENMIKAGLNLRKKSSCLFVNLRPFFRHLQHCKQSCFQKKTQEIKAELKVLQLIFKDFSLEISEESINSFYTYFSQYLNDLQGLNIAEIEQIKPSFQQHLPTINRQKEIVQLNSRKQRLQKQLLSLTRKYEKLQKDYEDLISTTEKQNQDKYNNVINQINKYQLQKNKNNQIYIQLKDQNQLLKLKIKRLQGQIKQQLHQRQKYMQQCLNTITKVKSQQQQVLLNQIMTLKKQFNADLIQIAQLNKIKQEEYLAKIKEQKMEIEPLKHKIQDLIRSNIEIEEIINSQKSQVNRFKKQNESLASDMHRLNQELYQHWLALKDIKMLSMRLDIFNKFKKIYQELLFNDQLFL